MNTKQNNNIKVLLVEDDEIDIESICRAFQKINLSVEWHIVKNGIEALEELYGGSNKQNIQLLPDLIIMDLNMPKMSGIEFLRQLRMNVALDSTKILILTTSDNHQDKLDTIRLNVYGYLMKPIKLNELIEVCKGLRNL